MSQLATQIVTCYISIVLLLRHTQNLIGAMAFKNLLELERAIASLSTKDKLWLLERIARQLRDLDEVELSDMANDPEIQAEITAINQDFALTEMDGLRSA